MRERAVGARDDRRRSRWRRAASGAACSVFFLASAVGASAQALLPTDDLAESFAADPKRDALWAAGGAWLWDPVAGAMVSGPKGAGSLFWTPGHSFTGSIRVRVKLISGASRTAPRARVYFAHDPATGANRYVQVTAGRPGLVVIGQTRSIRGTRPRIIRTLRTNIPKGRWFELGVQIGGKDRVSVSLGPKTVLSATIPPTVPGQIGVGTVASKVAFDSFVFTADPDQEPCRDCHAGSSRPEGAPEVYTYWDGTWWDRSQGGSPAAQQGGHGDSGGLFAMNCTGGAGCHNLRLPRVSHHRNGVFEPRENMTVNPWHLRKDFINENPARPWDTQMTFDDFCAAACHEGFGIRDMRHEGVSNKRPYLQMGYGLTDPQGAKIPEGIPLDEDLTSAAGRGAPHFGTCVSCHDPHGSGTTDVTSGSNHMVRLPWITQGTLCGICHI